jgi:hypothetical protein
MQRSFRVLIVIVALAVLVPAFPAQAADPFGATSCAGVRPGAIIQAPRGDIYTMGFLFEGTSAKGAKANYVTTVGDNILPAPATRKWPVGGPQAFDANGKAIGRFVYAVFTDTPNASSFGLVRIDPGVKVNPQMCHFGGPTGLYTDLDPSPRAVEYYGNGFPIDQVVPARTALASGTANEETVFVVGAVTWSIDTGDGGAPFLADGKALGYHNNTAGGGGNGAGFGIARLAPWIAKSQSALKLRLRLRTASLLD